MWLLRARSSHEAWQQTDLSQSFWQRAAELGGMEELHRLDAIEHLQLHL
ncbi:hypothetical protein [Synechococcus sp. CBW1002]|nr:hypothetical protein [Synechococcus sp. CBW1002]